MSFMNRIGNSGNRYQTEAKRVLCVCSAGLLRSPTTANVLHKEYGFNTRAVGCVEEYALIPVDEVLLRWANEVVFMELNHKDIVMSNFPTWKGHSIILGIPDDYAWNDPDLCNLILEKYKEKSNA